MISSTGRMPLTAAPNAAPVIASSEIGVSNTRVGAVLLVQAGRHREHAAGDRDVLAEEDHALVARELLVERLAERRPGTRPVRSFMPRLSRACAARPPRARE